MNRKGPPQSPTTLQSPDRVIMMHRDPTSAQPGPHISTALATGALSRLDPDPTPVAVWFCTKRKAIPLPPFQLLWIMKVESSLLRNPLTTQVIFPLHWSCG